MWVHNRWLRLVAVPQRGANICRKERIGMSVSGSPATGSGSGRSAQTVIPKSFAAVPLVMASISSWGTPVNCLAIHSCESGKEPSRWG